LFVFCIMGFELRAYTFSHSSSPIFCLKGFFRIGSQTICLGWFRTEILLISASWVARITGVSHQCPAALLNLKIKCSLLFFFQIFLLLFFLSYFALLLQSLPTVYQFLQKYGFWLGLQWMYRSIWRVLISLQHWTHALSGFSNDLHYTLFEI
jgi:hypothetical protein